MPGRVLSIWLLLILPLMLRDYAFHHKLSAMNHPLQSPLSALVDACSGTLARYLSFALAFGLPYIVWGLFSGPGLAVLPLVVIGSAATGWGLLIYPALFLSGFLYVRFEPSRWLLLLPLTVSALDLWRMSHAFAK